MQIKVHQIGHGLPLVLFHGWGFHHRIWLPLSEKIKDRYQLFLVDLPGFGGSSNLNWPDFKKTLLAQLPDHFHLLGWSLGGLYASRLALEESELVLSLTNVATSLRFIEDTAWPGVAKAVLEDFFARLCAEPEQVLSDFVAVQSNDRYFLKHEIPSMHALEEGLKVLATWDLRHRFSHFKKPASFLFGRLDRIVPVKMLESLQTAYPNCYYKIFKKSAHMPFLSEEEEFIQFLDTFLWQ